MTQALLDQGANPFAQDNEGMESNGAIKSLGSRTGVKGCQIDVNCSQAAADPKLPPQAATQSCCPKLLSKAAI